MNLKHLFEPLLYHIRCNKGYLVIGDMGIPITTLALLVEKNGMIIWENQGFFKLIPNSVLRNLRTRYENARSIAAVYSRVKPPKGLTEINWNQGIDIPSAVAKVLLTACKKRYELRKPDTTTDPTTEGKSDQ